MYWVEITGCDWEFVRVEVDGELALSKLIPMLSDAGLEAKFGLTGSPQVIGGCLGSSRLAEDEDLQS